MWSPTHIQVTVLRARGLLIKGKNDTNNCFVTIALGKEKYQTSVKDKTPNSVEWHEECELTIPDRGNRAELVLTALHRNNIGIDEFLGQATLPLNEMDAYDRPRSKWFKLESKPGKEKKKERGELEVRIMFIVKSGSLSDLSKKEKHKSSIGQLASSVGGSLLSIGTLEKRKSIKKFAKSLGSKMHLNSKKKDKDNNSDHSGSIASIGTPSSIKSKKFGQTAGDADPGVISEDEDEFIFDNLSNKSSMSSLNVTQQRPLPPPPIQQNSSPKDEIALRSKTLPPSKPLRSTASDHKIDEWEAKLYGKHLDIGSTDSLKRNSWENSRVVPLSTKETTETTESKIENVVKEQPESISLSPKLNQKEIIANTSTNTTTISPPPLKKVVVEKKEEEKFPDHKQLQILEKPKALPRSNTMSCITEQIVSEKSDKQDKSERKRFGKLRYFRKDKNDPSNDISLKSSHERIIIGGENSFSAAELKSVIPQEVFSKYEGKSREEVILIANDLEGECHYQRQRVKELEDYLDDLLLRVMETHPKILQNPYNRTSSTKSG